MTISLQNFLESTTFFDNDFLGDFIDKNHFKNTFLHFGDQKENALDCSFSPQIAKNDPHEIDILNTSSSPKSIPSSTPTVKTLSNYVSLHSHSYYSLLDGLSSPEQIVKTAKQFGMEAIALTDHGVCSGLYKFYKACNREGVKPILGMEAYCVPKMDFFDKKENKWHLTIWAKNKIGYKNLIELSSKGWCEGFYGKPRIDLELLSRLKDGLIVGSGCPVGVVCGPIFKLQDFDLANKNAIRLKEMFGQDFYMEIMFIEDEKMSQDKIDMNNAMEETYKIALNLNIKPIIACDSHYCKKEDAEAHDVLLSIQTRDTVKNKKRFSFNSRNFYIKNYDEMSKICNGREHLLTNTVELADKIEKDVIEISNDLLPDFEQPNGFDSPESYLKFLIKTGLEKHGLIDKPEYIKRMEFEFSVIRNCGYLKYFLILYDLVFYAKSVGIRVGPGRGSGVASLCLYCLGITALDPIKYDLMFERFLNPERISPPDVDIDFDHERQSEIFEYLSNKYSPDCIARIGTYGSLKTKDAIKRVAKALDIGRDWETADEKAKKGAWKSGKKTLDLADKISKEVPKDADITIKKALELSNGLRLYEKQFPKTFSIAQRLEGTLSSSGVHPAGIIVCKEPISLHSPLRRGRDECICTQFNMVEVEELGLLKIDILALNTLTTIERTMCLINQTKGEDFDINALNPDADSAVFRMLQNGDVEGVFQFEGSSGMKDLLRKMKVDCFEDMIAAGALYRPGPLENGMHIKYYLRKNGQEDVDYPHPILKDILKKTYGIIIYQEQTMEVAKKFAGFSNLDADTLRKAIGKKKPELIEKVRNMFLSGAKKQGNPDDISMKIWKLIETFGGYGFNRSHSAAYAFLAYQTAFLRCRFPREFFTSLLSTEKDEKKRLLYEKTCNKLGKRFKMSILDIDIDKSKNEYILEDEGIRQPISSLKGVGEKAAIEICKRQPFSGLGDFINRTNQSVVNSAVFKNLVDSGCLKKWAEDGEDILEKYEKLKDQYKKRTKKINSQKKKYLDLSGDNLFSTTEKTA